MSFLKDMISYFFSNLCLHLGAEGIKNINDVTEGKKITCKKAG